jgi:ribosomal protein S18 acetylase RimI-like enzyme
MSAIRNAVAVDASRISEIARAAYAKYVARIGREPAPMSTDFVAAIAAGHVVVVETDGLIDGYMIAWPEPEAYFIDDIAVDPAKQGRGLGRRLLEHAFDEAPRHGASAVTLYTNVAMTENLALYARLGFVETHRAMEQGFDRVYLRRERSKDVQ